MAFQSGKHGRGPTPYSTSMSRKPAGLQTHKATSGRGVSGLHGSHSQEPMTGDIEHPQSHSSFEALGVGGTEE